MKREVQTNPEENIKTRKTSFVDQYVTNPQKMSTKHDSYRGKNVRIRPETDINLIPAEPETTSQRKSQQPAKRKRSRSRNLLCRQDSVTNLSSLQDEISSMLNNNAGGGITETNGTSNFYSKSTITRWAKIGKKINF